MVEGDLLSISNSPLQPYPGNWHWRTPPPNMNGEAYSHSEGWMTSIRGIVLGPLLGIRVLLDYYSRPAQPSKCLPSTPLRKLAHAFYCLSPESYMSGSRLVLLAMLGVCIHMLFPGVQHSTVRGWVLAPVKHVAWHRHHFTFATNVGHSTSLLSASHHCPLPVSMATTYVTCSIIVHYLYLWQPCM